MSQYDVAVIGAGPGGYSAAIRSAQLGYSVVLIEKRVDSEGLQLLGGTCLNVGCIPSKALLHSAHEYHQVHQGAVPGLPELDLPVQLQAVLDRQQATVKKLVGGIGSRVVGEGVTVISGSAKVNADLSIDVAGTDGSSQSVQASEIILATGCRPRPIPGLDVDGNVVVESDQAISFSAVPETLAVVGGGIIGIEMAAAWAQLGSEVTVYEALPELLPMLDRDIVRLYQRYLTNLGITFKLNAKPQQTRVTADRQAELQYVENDSVETEIYHKVLVAVGREPSVKDCLNPELHHIIDERGYVQVDESLQTSQPHIWAIGDIVAGPQLAHRAIHQGAYIAEHILGIVEDYQEPIVPAVIYTHCEMAWFGKNESECTDEGIDFQTAKVPLAANGRYMSTGGKDGMLKLIASRSSEILGAQIFGPNAGDWLHILTAVAERNGTIEDLIHMCFAHPTYAESIHDIASAMRGKSIHIPNQVN